MKLLFIAGSGGGKEEWIYQTEYFANSEAISLPGHPEGKTYSSIDDHVEWLRGYIHQHGYVDVVLAGHSFGSAIAQLYGLKYSQEVMALVLIGAGARMRVLPAFLRAVEGMITDETGWRRFLEVTYGRVDPEIRRVAMAARMRIGPAVMLNDLLCCDKFDIMDRVHTIKLPTLVICGRQDDMTPVKYSQYLTDKIGGATQVIIEGAGHLVFLEKPAGVNQALERFLGGLS